MKTYAKQTSLTAPAMQSRKTHLDILKIIACFLVIVNHTNSRIFLSIGISPTWFLSLSYFYICKVAVPIFIMVSGALLLKKEESYKDVYRKRILKYAAVLVIFSLLYYLISISQNHGGFSLKEFASAMAQAPITTAYWYLYMLLGLLIMLPILRKMIPNLTDTDYIYFFILTGIFHTALPMLQHYFNMPLIYDRFKAPLFDAYIALFLFGHWIEEKLSRQYFTKNISLALAGSSFTCLAISLALTHYEYKKNNGTDYLFMDNCFYLTAVIPAITLFYLAKYWDISGKPYRRPKLIHHISTHTFGIYLLSDLLIRKLNFIYGYLVNYIHPLIAIAILETAVFLSGYALTFALKKIFSHILPSCLI